jgi:predicted MFS family arabinose efflux permease
MRTYFDSYRAAFGGLPRDVWILAWALFINRVGMMVLPFLALYLTEERGFDVDAAGRVVALFGVGSIFGVTFGGWLTDKIGPRRVQLASLVLNGLCLLALWRTRGPLAISAAVVVLSLASEIFRPANSAAIITASSSKQRARSFALMSAVICVGLSIGLPIAGALAEFGYDWLFWIDAGTSFLAFGFLARYGPRTPAKRTVPSAQVATRASAWRDREFLVVLGLSAAAGTILFQFFSTLPLFLAREVGLSETGVGLLLALNTLIIALSQMQLSQWVESRPLLRWIGWGVALMGIGYGVNGLSNHVAIAALSILIWTVGEMFYFPLTATYASHRAPPHALGRYMSAYHVGIGVPFLVAPLLGTEIYDRLGPTALWASCAVAGVILAASFIALDRASRSPTAPARSGP